MRKARKWISLFLVTAMTVTMLSACGGESEPSEGSQEPVENTGDDAGNDTGDDAQGETEDEPEEAGWDEVTDINVMLMDLRGVSEKAQPVIDAMNAITEESCGVRVNVTWAGPGDYPTQLNLAISGGEQLDLAMIIPIEACNFTNLTSKNQLMDITEYMNNEGKDALALVNDYIGAYSIDGKIYGLPAYRNYGSSVYLIMRKDILEQIGMVEKAENLTSWSEVEEIFAAVKEQTDVAPIGGAKNIAFQAGTIFGGDRFSNAVSYDCLSDVLNIVYTDSEGNVSLVEEQEAFKNHMDMIRRWNENGWIYKDSITMTDHVDTVNSTGVIFSTVQTSELGVEASKKEATGYDMVCVELAPNMLASAYVNKFGIGVPSVAQEPEAAIRWVNELYTNPELENLLVWGIEGEDYVLKDGEADYPDGVTADSVSYHTADFLYGNTFLAYPWAGNGADFRDVAMDALKAAPISPYLGFAVDQSDMDNVITALTGVMDKYKGKILCGDYTDEEYEQFVAELKTAGVEEYLAEYQRQLQAWMAEN